MDTDIFILNTAVVDFRSKEFEFAEKLAGAGGLAKCKIESLPSYTQEQYNDWIKEGSITAGGPGNTAPLIARVGIKTAVGVNLGKGDFDGLDAQGRYFFDTMVQNKVDMSETFIHENLPTGTTFIYEKGNKERGGIVYFPNANNDFDFERFKASVNRLKPKIVYYMYSGLSERGDTNGGKDLSDFINWCHARSIVTIVDSHTLTGNPQSLINAGIPVPEYKLLEPLLPELDIFFTSFDEAKLIENTLDKPRAWNNFTEDENIIHFLDFLSERFWKNDNRTQLFGVTVKDGAWYKSTSSGGSTKAPEKIQSRFMTGDVIDLVGAGDSFRAGFLSYVAKNIDQFRNGNCDLEEAIQMGNLFASLYIKAPLNDRYKYFTNYNILLSQLRGSSPQVPSNNKK